MNNRNNYVWSLLGVIVATTVVVSLTIKRFRRYAHLIAVNDPPLETDRVFVDSLITSHPDFPKKGVIFRDIFPLLRNPDASAALVRLLKERLDQLGKIDVIVGLESRGFLYGPLLALLKNCSFVPIRKSGKLPGVVATISYEKEYGKDGFEIQRSAIERGNRVVIFDDLLATGGSLYASIQLLTGLHAEVVECIVIIELHELNGRKIIQPKTPVWSIFRY